jgi:cell division protein ZapA
MTTVPVRINGKDYAIACDDGQEEHLMGLSFDLNERIGQLNYQMGGNPGEVMAMLLAGLMMTDEAIENKKEIERLSKEVRQLTQAVSQQSKMTKNPEAFAEIEKAMILTMNEIAGRIEKIADQVEMR